MAAAVPSPGIPAGAGLVANARDYYWSSYRANAEGDPDSFVDPHPAYRALGQSLDERTAAYRQLFEVRLPESELDLIRKATRGGYPVGEKRPPRGRTSRTAQEQTELPALEAVK